LDKTKNIIFQIPLYGNSPSQFKNKQLRRLCNYIPYPIFCQNLNQFKETYILLEREFYSRNPKNHSYNDIVGYIELSINESTIWANYYLNGDGRKKYNRDFFKRYNKKGIFFRDFNFTKLNSTEIADKKLIHKKVSDLLKDAKFKCENWKIHANISHYIELSKHLDYKNYLDN